MRAFRSPWAIFIAALLVRAVLAHAAWAWMSRDGKAQAFPRYEPANVAAHLANGQGFSSPYPETPIRPTAQQPPLYPYLLSLIFRVAGCYTFSSLLLVLGINALLGSIVPLLILKVGRLYFSDFAGIAAAWFWVIIPAMGDLAIANYLLMSMFILVWLLLLPKAATNLRGFIVLGSALGIGALLNPMIVVLYPASLSFLRQRLRLIPLAVAATFLVVSPWIVRNYLALGRVYPALRDNLGLELYVGNHPGMSENELFDYAAPDVPSTNPQLYATLGESDFMQLKMRQATEYIRSHPWLFITRSARRMVNFWLFPYYFFYLPLCLLALPGALCGPRRVRNFVLALFALYPAVFYLTQTECVISYRHPVEPFLALCAMIAIDKAIPHMMRFTRIAFARSPQNSFN